MIALKTIWFATNQMCSKKLKAALPDWLPHYEQEKSMLCDLLRGQLHSLSPSTIERWLAPYREGCSSQKGLCGTKPGTLLKNQIPLKLIIRMLIDLAFWRQIPWRIVEILWPVILYGVLRIPIFSARGQKFAPPGTKEVKALKSKHSTLNRHCLLLFWGLIVATVANFLTGI